MLEATLPPMRIKERTEFGARLFEARTDARLSQAELAKRVGMSQNNLSYLEQHGTGSPKIASLARECGVRLLWLERGEGPKNESPAHLALVDHAAEENAPPPYLPPNTARDFRTIAFTLADALEQQGVSISVRKFLALVDATFQKIGKE